MIVSSKHSKTARTLLDLAYVAEIVHKFTRLNGIKKTDANQAEIARKNRSRFRLCKLICRANFRGF
jgi:hypothetical protein